MKKLFQICLIAILVFVLFQAVAGGATMIPEQIDLVATSHHLSTTNLFIEGVHLAASPVKGPTDRTPMVGWNS